VNNGNFIWIAGITHIAGIWRFCILCIIGFYNVILTVKQFIANQLYLNRSVAEALHGKNSNILGFMLIECNTQYNGVKIAFSVIKNHYIIDQIVSVQVKIIYHGIFIIQASFKIFKGF
jgi:hypothetical protein